MAASDTTGSRDKEEPWDITVARLSGTLYHQMGISNDGPNSTGGPSFGQSNEHSLDGGTETPKEVDMDSTDGESRDGSVEFVDMPSLSIQTGSDSYSDWSMDSISSSELADLREGEKQTAGEDTGGEMSTRATSSRGNCRPVCATHGGRVHDDSSGDSLGPARSSQHRAPPKQPRERGGGLTGRRKSYKRKECNGGGPRKKRHTHSARLRRSQSRQDKWKRAQSDEGLKKKYRDFSKGAAAFAARIHVTDKDIREAMQRSSVPGEQLEQGVPAASLVGEVGTAEMNELRRTMELLRDGGYGYLPQHKQSGNVRIIMENFNSLGICTQSWKIDKAIP
jgi:hypothetical protein